MLVTAGGTEEPIDPIRCVTNLSSGKQGLAVARAAMVAGAEVTLIATRSVPPSPYGIKRIVANSAADVHAAVLEELSNANILVMVAAVADYRPDKPEQKKIKKTSSELVLKLIRTVDVLGDVGARRTQFPALNCVVGFAAETENLLENALSKLHEKRLDMVVANDVSRTDIGMGADQNKVTIVTRVDQPRVYPVLSKIEVGNVVVSQIRSFLGRA
jgi:phosphopantothenoylcysteine decarboxylase/phosphopantothenate--cysteine ligase